MQLTDLEGKNVVIWGAGREAAAVIHAMRTASVSATLSIADEGDEGSADLDGVAIHRGAPAVAKLRSADVIVRSPGVSPNRPDTQLILADVPAHTTATNLFFARNRTPVIGVTGTKGKSTTASLIAHLLVGLGVEARLAGNIGRSPLHYFGEAEPDVWVLELSSYQTADLHFSPDIGVLTSLSPEHLDWHGDYDRYVKDKLNLFAHGVVDVVINAADPGADEVGDDLLGHRAANNVDGVHVADGQFKVGNTVLFSTENVQLLGLHNQQLICTALTALEAFGIDLPKRSSDLSESLAAFSPLEHRLQPVSQVNGITWVDDGLSTTPMATIAALDAFADRRCIVLAGGHDRGLDYSDLASYVVANSERVTLITMPDSGERIADAVHSLRLEHQSAEVHSATDLQHAVDMANDLTPVGGVVLLSPGAPSFGRFANYEERSAAFVSAVEGLAKR